MDSIVRMQKWLGLFSHEDKPLPRKRHMLLLALVAGLPGSLAGIILLTDRDITPELIGR